MRNGGRIRARLLGRVKHPPERFFESLLGARPLPTERCLEQKVRFGAWTDLPGSGFALVGYAGTGFVLDCDDGRLPCQGVVLHEGATFTIVAQS
jgi:hypothetical protein